MDEWELEILRKIDNKEELTESEISDLASEFKVDVKYSSNRRWSRSATTISEIDGRYFRIQWENGLTEKQPNEYDNQPVEVYKHTYDKTITVTEWRNKNDN